MKMKKIYLYSLILILLILQSCTFKLKDEKFVTLDSTGKIPDIQINLNLAADTIYILEDQTITFAYAPNGDQINWARFLVNGEYSDVQKDQSGNIKLTRSFTVSPKAAYPLELQIFTKSQTGSIAEAVGAEGYLLSRKWTIVTLSIAQLSPRITKDYFIDGSFKFEWEKYKGPGFMNYKIYKTLMYSQKGKFLLATINSREQTSYIDSTYCGDASLYLIVTNDKYQAYFEYLKSGPIPILTVENKANDEILLKWSKPPYYKNMKGYRISYTDNVGIEQQIAEIDDPTIESFNFTNPLFAYNYQIYLTPLGKIDNNYSISNRIYLSTSAYASIGLPFPTFENALSGQGSMIYLIDSKQQITLFDPLNFTTVRQIKYNEGINKFAGSPNDKYLVSMGITFKKIYFEDLSDPTKSKSIDIPASIPQTVNNISNSGTGVLMTLNKGILYDFINERILAEFNLPGNYSYSNKISASGNFIYLDTYSDFAFYQYKDNQTILLESGINQGDDLILDCYFLPGTPEKMVRVYHNRIEILDCSTWTIEKKWLIPNLISHVNNFDIKSGKLLFNRNNKMILFDVINGTEEELTTIYISSYSSTSFFYNDGYLFWNGGKALNKN